MNLLLSLGKTHTRFHGALLPGSVCREGAWKRADWLAAPNRPATEKNKNSRQDLLSVDGFGRSTCLAARGQLHNQLFCVV